MAQAPAFPEAALGEPGVLRAVLGAALYLTVVGLLGLGLGALLGNTAGGISALFGVLFVVLFVVLGALTLERSSRRVFLDDHELPLRRQEGVRIEHQRSVLFTPGATRSVLFTPGATAVGRIPTITTLRGHGYRLGGAAPHRARSPRRTGRKPR